MRYVRKGSAFLADKMEEVEKEPRESLWEDLEIWEEPLLLQFRV